MEGTSNVLTSAAGSVDVSLHPLVIMNISDHCTRARVEQKSPFRGSCCIVFVLKRTFSSCMCSSLAS